MEKNEIDQSEKRSRQDQTLHHELEHVVQQMNRAQLNPEDMEKQVHDMKEEFKKLHSLFK